MGIKLLVASALVVWLLTSGRLDFSVLLEVQHYGYVALAGSALVASFIAQAWRWVWLIKIQELEISTWTALRLTWIGLFANLFLPGGAGGDLAKAYAACRHQPDAKTRAVSTVLVDRLVGLHSLLFVASAAGFFVIGSGCSARQAAVAWVAMAAFAIGTVWFLLLWLPHSDIALRIMPGRFRKPLGDSLVLYRRAWKRIFGIWLYSAFCNALAIASYILVAASLGTPATFWQVLAVPLVIVANALPISPGGLGVGETVGSQLFSEFGLPNGGIIVLVVRLGMIVVSLPGAAAILGRTKAHRPSSRPDSATP